jgi:hypothetical protein
LPGNPENAAFSIVLRFSHFVKPIFPGGDPEIRVDGKDFVFPMKNYNNETAAYETDDFKIIDFKLPENFSFYTTDGSHKVSKVKRFMFWDARAAHPNWSNYTAFDVIFSRLPYGDTVNTTRIFYDPIITIYHPKPASTITTIKWFENMWPIFLAVGVAVSVLATYMVIVRRRVPSARV